MAIETWPATLPSPQKSFDCRLQAGLADDQEQINSQRTRTYPERESNFSLILTQSQFEILLTFYKDTLHGGGELFEADWLEDGGFDHHRLRFLKPFVADFKGTVWKIKMNLEIISGVPFDGTDPDYWICEE